MNTIVQGENLIVQPGTALPDPCPNCNFPIRLRITRYGLAYLCTNYPYCDYSVGAHNDGTPLGTPAGSFIKALRKTLHDCIDPYWKDRANASEIRKEIYKFMASELDLEEFHVSHLDIDVFPDALRIAQRELPKHF